MITITNNRFRGSSDEHDGYLINNPKNIQECESQFSRTNNCFPSRLTRPNQIIIIILTKRPFELITFDKHFYNHKIIVVGFIKIIHNLCV